MPKDPVEEAINKAVSELKKLEFYVSENSFAEDYLVNVKDKNASSVMKILEELYKWSVKEQRDEKIHFNHDSRTWLVLKSINELIQNFNDNQLKDYAGAIKNFCVDLQNLSKFKKLGSRINPLASELFETCKKYKKARLKQRLDWTNRDGLYSHKNDAIDTVKDLLGDIINKRNLSPNYFARNKDNFLKKAFLLLYDAAIAEDKTELKYGYSDGKKPTKGFAKWYLDFKDINTNDINAIKGAIRSIINKDKKYMSGRLKRLNDIIKELNASNMLD